MSTAAKSPSKTFYFFLVPHSAHSRRWRFSLPEFGDKNGVNMKVMDEGVDLNATGDGGI